MSSVKKYRHIKNEVEAIQFHRDNYDEVKNFILEMGEDLVSNVQALRIPRTPDGIASTGYVDRLGHYHTVDELDYIVKTPTGLDIYEQREFENIFEPIE